MSNDRHRLRKLRIRRERLRRQKHRRRSQPKGIWVPDFEDWEPEEEEDAPEFRLPPRYAAERELNKIHHLLEGHHLESVEELNAFLQTLSLNGPDPAQEQKLGADPNWRAQELAYQALDSESGPEAVTLARRALELDPDCVDARVVLARNTARSLQEFLRMLRQAVETGGRAFGKEFFEENRGHFWGILKTRPYMRARHDLAGALLLAGQLEEAIGHLEALLELNPNDNQGVRDELLGLYLLQDDLEKVGRLFRQYEGDGSAIFCWGRILERFLSREFGAASLALEEARAENGYVEQYLTGQKPLPRQFPEYYTPGRENEARHCAFYLGPAWERHPEAVNWLKRH